MEGFFRGPWIPLPISQSLLFTKLWENICLLNGTNTFSRSNIFVLPASPIPKFCISFIAMFLIMLLLTYFCVCVSIKANDTAFFILSIFPPSCMFPWTIKELLKPHSVKLLKLPILGMLMCRQIYVHQKTSWKMPL